MSDLFRVTNVQTGKITVERGALTESMLISAIREADANSENINRITVNWQTYRYVRRGALRWSAIRQLKLKPAQFRKVRVP